MLDLQSFLRFWQNVTAQVGWHQTVRRERINSSGSCMSVLRIFQLCFLAVESTDRMTTKSSALSWARNPPEIFCRSFIMRASASAWLLVKGTLGSCRNRNTSLLGWCRAREEVRPAASRLPAATLGAAQRRQRLMKGEPLRHDGVVTPLDARDQSRFERNATLAGEIDGVTGPTQQDLHLARPVLVIELDQRLQFPQMMSVAQGMQHVLHHVVRLPVVMHHDANDAGHEAAAVGADPIKGEKSSRGDVQPLGLAAEAKAGFVQVLDLGAAHLLAHRIDEALQPIGATAAHPGDGRWDQAHAEEIAHHLARPSRRSNSAIL